MALPDFAKMTKKESNEWLTRVLGKPTRKLAGDEYDQVQLLLQFLDPVSESNNQQFCSDKFEHAGFVYHVHYIGENPIIEVEEEYPE